MAWLTLDSLVTFNNLLEESKNSPKIIFKHSTRCSISAMALNRLKGIGKKIDIHIIDVINNRDISNAAVEKLSVMHQSPQLLIILGAKCQYHASHMEITPAAIEQFFSSQS